MNDVFEAIGVADRIRAAGDRWIIVGDAGSFLDPVFSSGVAIALESGLERARAVDRALARGRVTAGAFAGFDAASGGATRPSASLSVRLQQRFGFAESYFAE